MCFPVFLIISGVTWSCSLNKAGGLIDHWFKPAFFLTKEMRFIIPFGFVFGIEIIKRNTEITPYLFKLFFQGGFFAQGNYYISFLFQLLIIFPFLYAMSRRPFAGTICVVCFCFFYEMLAVTWGMSGFNYRLFIGRGLLFGEVFYWDDII